MLLKPAARLACTVVLFAATALATTVTVTTPTNNTAVSTPAKFVASASSPNGVSSMAIFVDGTRVFFQWTNSSITAYLWLSPGRHNILVQATDNANVSGSSSLSVRSNKASGTVADIDDWDGWEHCTEASCAGGGGTSITWTAANQTSPSLSGASSRQFYLGGSGSYSNALWWKFVGGSSTAKNFLYDVWVYVQQPTLPQALEFDVNQSFSQVRWVFGTECNFKGSGKWDVWDGGAGRWVPTSVDCPPFPANTWVHVQWEVYRTGPYVHYTSVTINGVKHPVGIELGRQPYWTGSDIDVAVQLDGDSQQDPYSIWVDKVSLTAW
jgi:Bacterial Ig domain